MPIINVQMWSGRSEEDKERLIAKLTEATCEALCLPDEAVTVILTEVEKRHWGLCGKPATVTHPD